MGLDRLNQRIQLFTRFIFFCEWLGLVSCWLEHQSDCAHELEFPFSKPVLYHPPSLVYFGWLCHYLGDKSLFEGSGLIDELGCFGVRLGVGDLLEVYGLQLVGDCSRVKEVSAGFHH